jgi:hypothetical protein
MIKTSIGVQELRTRIGEKAKAEPQHRFWGLYTHVWKLDVLREAYRLAKVRAPAHREHPFQRILNTHSTIVNTPVSAPSATSAKGDDAT